MTIDRKEILAHVSQTFAGHPGNIAVIVQSKTDPALGVAINDDTPLPSASLIKIAIACAAADDPQVNLSKSIKVSDLDATFYCSILQAFDPIDEISLKSLIGLMLIVSDNPATTALLDTIGMDKVNAWLVSNGLNDTNLNVGFEDASLGVPLRANLTTAQDCFRLLRRVDTDPAYAFIKHMLANNLRNERIPKQLPDEAVIAHKTGTLNGLMHDIAMIESPDAAYYLVILADELSEDANFAGKIADFSSEIYSLMSA